jgi:fatty-acyl-CoA synthase
VISAFREKDPTVYDVTLSKSCFPAQTDLEIWETSVGDLLREVAARDPAAPALVEVTQSGETDRRWTYGALLEESETLASALASRFEPGERIVVWAPNIPEWVLMEYAAAIAGLVLVTANPAFQAKELRYVIEQSGAVALFLVESYRGNPMADIALEAIEGLAAVREMMDLNNREVLFRRGDRMAGLPDVSPGDAAQIQYTSGTTGFPKGAVLSHRGLVNNARFYARRCGVTRESVWVNPMPMFHTIGCGMTTLGCLQAGCQMVLVSLFDPSAINRLIETERAAFILAVPTMLIAMLEAFDGETRDVSTLALVSSGGAMVPPELVRRVTKTFDCGFSILYGQTESSPVMAQHHATDSLEDIQETVGQPLDHTDISIRRVDDNTVVEIGEVGEICARGPSTMIGYHENQEATDAAIDAERWLHTGDLGTMDRRGYVRVTGRVKEMIIRGGENHFPAEIENVLLTHPDVADVAIVGLPDEKWGEIIAAFLRMEDGRPLDEAELRGHCRANLSPQKTPAVWTRVDAFPLTGSGKIQKFRLRDQYLAGEFGE